MSRRQADEAQVHLKLILASLKLVLMSFSQLEEDDTQIQSHRSVTLLDAIFTHDVKDAMPDGVPVPPTPGEPCHCQPGKEPALGILAGSCLQQQRTLPI